MPAVNVIDSIIITKENDKTKVLAEWSVADPSIKVYSELTSGYAAKLYLNWSDKNGTINLRQGDYFTFVISDIFNYIYIHNVSGVEITDAFGEVVATYSIDDNNNNMKEVKITFTNYVETHTNISGDFWILLFVGQVSLIEEKNLEFIINDELKAEGNVTIKPRVTLDPKDNKVGFSLPKRSAGGYYIFEWLVYINMGKNVVNGFNTLENFSFEDSLPTNSPHIFLTDKIRQELGLSPTAYQAEIGEYLGADSYSPEDRYQIFYYHFNSTDENIWYNYIKNWAPLVNGHKTVGIDGDDGLNVSDVEIADKLFAANLGTVTRPTAIRFFTVATVKLAESALGDSEVVGLFKNTFKGNSIKELPSSLSIYRFESGGSAQGITGPYDFMLTKVDEKDTFLPGALFSLYTSENFETGLADRFIYSDDNGVVAFKKIPEGIYYLLEEVTPNGYIPNKTIYKVVISSVGFEIYYGENFENKLSDNDNKIVNKFKNQTITLTLIGLKELTGQTLASGMFNFIVKNSAGETAATGTNDVSGRINFSELKFDSPGIYIFTIEEVSGSYSGMTYDKSKFIVTVTVIDDGSGIIIDDVSYPAGGVVFNNIYAAEIIKVKLEGTKKLTGKTLASGMFSFIVKNDNGAMVATGTNDASGSINFSELQFNSPGVYTFTVEEVASGYSGYTYDSSKYNVTVKVTVDEEGKLKAEVVYPDIGVVFNNRYAETPTPPCKCYSRATKCRKSIIGKKIWVGDDNVSDKRPDFAEIVLLRDGEFYRKINVDSTGDGAFIFYCIPIWKNPSHKYNYQIDEINVPDGYTKKVEGNNVINTLIL